MNDKAADARRAMALISHHTRGHQPGINAIIREAVDADRATELLLAVLDAYPPIVNVLRTAEAQGAMTELVHQIAEFDDDPDWQRAARTIIASATRDLAAMLQIVDEANDQKRCPQLLGSVCGVYGLLLPELATPIGCDAISTITARLTAREAEGDR
ncbi:hypothetical protein [Mycobacterium adipatum]|uniref:hypothetical protein n=1 Tax=Mycobacterium adipatum TaxID=1682113 RepID=UPI0034E0CF44